MLDMLVIVILMLRWEINIYLRDVGFVLWSWLVRILKSGGDFVGWCCSNWNNFLVFLVIGVLEILVRVSKVVIRCIDRLLLMMEFLGVCVRIKFRVWSVGVWDDGFFNRLIMVVVIVLMDLIVKVLKFKEVFVSWV